MEAGSVHGELLMVPERVILAPAPGKFRPVDEASRRREPTLRRAPTWPASRSSASSTASATPRPSAARSTAASWACWPRPGSGCARASRWRGSAWPTDAGRHRPAPGIGVADRRLGDGGPRAAGHQPRPGPDGRHQRRLDHRAHRHQGAAVGGRGRDHRHPGHRGRRGRHQAGRPVPVRHRLLHRRHLHPRAAHPAHRRLRPGRPGPALRRLRHRRRLLRLRLRPGGRAPPWSPPAASGRCCVIGSETLSRVADPDRPLARASSSATGPARWCSCPAPSPTCCPGTWLRRLHRPPAGHPRRRQPPARPPPRRSPPASTG